jgi:hypothetical protein
MTYKISYSLRFDAEGYAYKQNVNVAMTKGEYQDFLKRLKSYGTTRNHKPMRPNETIFTCLVQRVQIMHCLNANKDKRYIRWYNTTFHFNVK